MSRTMQQILASHQINADELATLVQRFDANGDGQLQGDEVRAFAAELAPLVGSTLDDLMTILDFYQLDDDPALSPDEVRGFIEIQI